MTARARTPRKLRGRLLVETEAGAFLGDVRIRLLEAIDRAGAISRAAKEVPLSYKAAWDAIDAMNNIADHPVVLRSTGGAGGGGTVLTDYGRHLVALYRAMELEYQRALDRIAGPLAGQGVGNVRELQATLRRMSMRTSARNQFLGKVRSLGETAAGFEVRLDLGESEDIAALITRESVEHLELAIGVEVCAFVKAAAVRLARVDGARAGPGLRGKVARVREGAKSAEVAVLTAGRRTVTALVGRHELGRLQLRIGAACRALIDPAVVTLVRFD
jgi:molybdate transport system regulatory protein